MTVAYAIGIAIALASIWGAAYLLKLWHEDAALLRQQGVDVTHLRTWPFSRVLAYVAVACTLASNFLIVPTVLRFTGVINATIVLAPLSITAFLVLDISFVVIAAYLRIVRSRS